MDNTTKIIKLLSEVIATEPDDLNDLTKLTPEYGVEPIDLAKLVIECEKAFRVKIHDEHVHEFKTVDDIALYIERIYFE